MQSSLYALSRFTKQLIGTIVTLALLASLASAAEIVGQWGTGEYYEVHVADKGVAADRRLVAELGVDVSRP